MKKILTGLLCAILLLMGTAVAEDDLLLYLTLDEGAGLTIHDASGNAPDKELTYGLAYPVFQQDSQSPQWRSDGVLGGCLLLDGSTTYLNYGKNDIGLEGGQLTVSAWIAPRMFEWDDPHAADNGTDKPTGIIGQSNKADNQGFLLGYGRFGRLTFQVGTGEEWLSLWTYGDNLQKYQWNHVAATFDGEQGEMTLYLNGELVSSRSVPVGSAIQRARNKALTVGRNPEGERLAAGFLNVASGYLDEVRVYSRALTEDEVIALYDSATPGEIAFSDIWLQNVLTEDWTRTQFHAGPYQFWMNEPHAPLYYNGMYHLFYQANMTGSYWRNICWGHYVSDDMINWKPVKEAITPMEYTVVPDGVWSGNAGYDVNGVPLLFFTAGNDDFGSVPGLISNQNIGVAYPADLTDPELTEWVVADELAVIQQPGEGRRGEFRDPYVWQQEGAWYMLICSGSVSSKGGAALLYRSDRLELLPDGTVDQDWQYVSSVYEMPNQSTYYGTSWELPILMPVTNQDGTITRWMFEISPAPASIADNNVYYFLGDFDIDTGTFTPDPAFKDIPRRLDYGCNVFTGPSAFVDPVSGNIVMFSIMQDQRGAADQGASGWAHTVGLARNIWLNDDGTDLMMAPIPELSKLEGEVLVDARNLTMDEANALLENVHEDMMHIVITATVKDAKTFGLMLKQGDKWDETFYTYEVASQVINGETGNRGDGASTSYVSGSLPLNSDGTIGMEIYVDRSLVEAFFNQSKSLSIRAYVDEVTSQNMYFFGEGDFTIDSLYVATMNPIACFAQAE